MFTTIRWQSDDIIKFSAPLVLCCDQFDRGSRQVKCEPVDLVTEDYDVSLCQQIVLDLFYELILTTYKNLGEPVWR